MMVIIAYETKDALKLLGTTGNDMMDSPCSQISHCRVKDVFPFQKNSDTVRLLFPLAV